MRVEVKLHATLATFLPRESRDGVALVELDEAATVGALVARLAIPDDLARVVLVDGHDVPDHHVLRAGSVVDIFPPLAGGARSPVVHSIGSGSV
jgi:molybdopterin converting factor small subunit